MKRNKKAATSLIIALLVAVMVAAPGFMLAFTVIGGSLGLSAAGNGYQRDFRVWNNSTDPASNNNVTPNSTYPGALGAVMAVWKAAKAWASETPTASRNFDYDFQGTNTSAAADSNTVHWGSAGCGGGTLAYCETPISDGWRILMCDSYNWEDGPGSPGFGANDFDIQGVAAHEIGHALGMGHSQVGNCGGSCSGQATMCPSICFDGVTERDLTADDQAGLQSIYGVKPANKPTITSLSGSFANGGTLIINGSQFAANVNVKFTAGTGQNLGAIPGVVAATSSGGGTQISVVIPAAAIDGNVIVWEPTLGLMSNAFPIDVNFIPPAPPVITSITPPDVTAFQGGTVTINGTAFTGATSITVGAATLMPPAGFTVVGSTAITFTAATAAAIGPVAVTVTTPNGTSAPMNFNYVETIPAKLTSPAIAFSNLGYAWSFAAGLNDLCFVIVSTDPTTVDYGTPYQILLNYAALVLVNTNGTNGLGSYAITMPPGLQGVTFYSQIVALDDVTFALHASNITQAFILF